MLSKIGKEHLVSTVHACATPQVFLGNLETTVILVRVARPYITESWELLQLQDTFGKVGKPGMVLKDEQLMAIQHIYNDKDMFVRLLGYGNLL